MWIPEGATRRSMNIPLSCDLPARKLSVVEMTTSARVIKRSRQIGQSIAVLTSVNILHNKTIHLKYNAFLISFMVIDAFAIATKLNMTQSIHPP